MATLMKGQGDKSFLERQAKCIAILDEGSCSGFEQIIDRQPDYWISLDCRRLRLGE